MSKIIRTARQLKELPKSVVVKYLILRTVSRVLAVCVKGGYTEILS